jgi:hypothetical protein
MHFAEHDHDETPRTLREIADTGFPTLTIMHGHARVAVNAGINPRIEGGVIMAKQKQTEVIAEIKPIKIAKAIVTIEGTTPLIVHAWSEKAKKQMLDAQMKVAKVKGREAKNPVEDAIQTLYWLTPQPEEMTMEAFAEACANGAEWGFPVTAIKQAAATAAYRIGATKDTKTMKGSFYIRGTGTNLLSKVITSGMPEMREDMVKIAMGTADLRYRMMFPEWRMELGIEYLVDGPFSFEQIVNAINLGGFMCGIGEWRAERDGQYGMFHIVT